MSAVSHCIYMKALKQYFFKYIFLNFHLSNFSSHPWIGFTKILFCLCSSCLICLVFKHFQYSLLSILHSLSTSLPFNHQCFRLSTRCLEKAKCFRRILPSFLHAVQFGVIYFSFDCSRMMSFKLSHSLFHYLMRPVMEKSTRVNIYKTTTVYHYLSFLDYLEFLGNNGKLRTDSLLFYFIITVIYFPKNLQCKQFQVG